MAIDFPATTGQATDGSFAYTSSGITWAWDGTTWKAQGVTGSYVLPTASATGLGGVKIGSGISISTGTISSTLQSVVDSNATCTSEVFIQNKLYFSNNFTNLTALNAVNASTYHGMFAHVHAEGHGYFAHAGAWTQLLDTGSSINELSDVTTGSASTNDVLTWSGSAWAATGATYYTNSDVDTHLNVSAASSGQILSWNGSDYAWVADQTGGSGLQSRTTGASTASALANNASANLTITAAKTYALHKIQTSHAAWVTLYTDTTSRTQDASRTESTDPVAGSGVIAEVITSDGATQKITPAAIGYNDDGTPSTNAYVKVVNKSGSTANVTVTLHFVSLEA